MTKFHINKKGVPARCNAKEGNCPLGGDEQHFKTKEDAQKFADNELSKTHGLVSWEKKYTQDELETLFKSKDENDRVEAVENGIDDYNIVKDESPLVKLAAIKKGLFLDAISYDENEEVASAAKEAYGKTPFGKVDNLFNELVPSMGRAETVAGEIVRAISRLNYRFYNDGDIVGLGYGNETCNSSARYLTEKLMELDAPENVQDELGRTLNQLTYSDETYGKGLEKTSGLIADWINNSNLRELKNTEDSTVDFIKPEDLSYDDDNDEDYEEDYDDYDEEDEEDY